MNQQFKVVASGKYVPSDIVTNQDLEKIIDTSDEWIRTRTGIKERRKANEEVCSDLATLAARDAIERYQYDLNNIDIIIVATITGEQQTPSIANVVQGKLGITRPIMSFDINAACTGFVYALDIASSLLQTKRFKSALVIGSERLSNILDYTDRNTCILFGDGAGALIIEQDDQAKPSYFLNGAKPDLTDVLTVRGTIAMDGKRVYQFAVDIVEKSIINVVEQAGLKLTDIDRILPHQANERIIQSVSKSLSLPMEKFAMNIENYGNTSAASIPILLAEYMADGHQNETILVVGFGGGFTFGAAIFYI